MKFSLVTGASKGIGKAIAIELAKRGYNVILIARTEDLLKDLSGQLIRNYKIAAPYLSIDLSEPASAKKIYDWCLLNSYSINMLVNNAGYGLSGLFQNYSLEEHLNMMQVNITSIVQLTYLFLPQLKKEEQAYILNISSSAAYQAVPYLSVYSASKLFVLSFSRALRYELKNEKVSVTCVSPGATDTNFPIRANVGLKAKKMAKKFQMPSTEVAVIAVDAMLKRKAETITGFLNKLSVFFAWLLPKKIVEKAAASIYE